MLINVSDGKSYLSQRDNKIRPHETCAPTSLAMALLYSGVKLPELNGVQPEDALTDFVNSDPTVQAFYKKTNPMAVAQRVPANEVHAVLEYGTNRWVGRTVVSFSTMVRMSSIISDLLKGRAVVVSGLWSGLRHVVCVVGFETSQEDISADTDPTKIMTDKIQSVIIDDPYGKYQTKYQDRFGNDVVVPYKDFISNTRELGSERQKWAYRIVAL